MQPGLRGRRIALAAGSAGKDDRSAVVRRTLEQAGALVHPLGGEGGAPDDWHGAKYAALVLLGQDRDRDPRVLQLAREMILSDKPVAAWGGAVGIVLDAGAAAGRKVAAGDDLAPSLREAGAEMTPEAICADASLITARPDADIAAFAERVTREFAEQLEEHELDEGSDLSFPASDPPAHSPGTSPPRPEPRA